jgi:hypothetical protein
MTRLRLTITQLMAVVLYFGFGLAALRNANDFWASATFTVAIAAISLALVGALARKGRARMIWAGIAVFGWVYLLIVLLPPRHNGGLGFGPIPWPHLLIEWGAACLQPFIYPLPPGAYPLPPGTSGLLQYEQVGHSLGIILFGLAGAVLGRLVAVSDDRPNP